MREEFYCDTLKIKIFNTRDEMGRIAAEDFGLRSVHGGCDKDNIASKRAMEKGGMVQYGTEEDGDPLFRFSAKQ